MNRMDGLTFPIPLIQNEGIIYWCVRNSVLLLVLGIEVNSEKVL